MVHLASLDFHIPHGLHFAMQMLPTPLSCMQHGSLWRTVILMRKKTRLNTFRATLNFLLGEQTARPLAEGYMPRFQQWLHPAAAPSTPPPQAPSPLGNPLIFGSYF